MRREATTTTARILLQSNGMRSLRHSTARLLLLVLAFSSIPAAWGAEPLPEPSRTQTPDAELFGKSLEAATQATRVYGAWDNPEALARVSEIGYRVAKEANYDDYPISFFLADMAEPNAFALPGGHIFVTRGMLELGLSDDALAALLGHEIGHVVRKHGMRLERKAMLLNILSQAVLVGVAVAADKNRDPVLNIPDPYGYYNTRDRPEGNLVYGSYAASVILSELLLRSYSRDYEDESDMEGQRWASAAGFATDGTVQLMALLGSRLPDSSREYGYWRTHPFFDQRVLAAKARQPELTAGAPRPADEFRVRTQAAILAFESSIQPEKRPEKPGPGERRPERGPGSDEGKPKEPPVTARELLHLAALTAWPVGPAADRLRSERLHSVRDRAIAGPASGSRDYGRALAAYDEEIGTLQALAPESPVLATFRTEREAVAKERDSLRPAAIEVWKSGVYGTPFLEVFLSNYPDAAEAPAVHLTLGEAYARTSRQADAVDQFLAAWKDDPEGPSGEAARRGLRNLAPALDQLSALAELAEQQQDGDLRRLAEERLATKAGTYSDIADGAAYLAQYPTGPYAEAVTLRLNALAEGLFGELLLYQSVGDQMKAMDRIQRILTHAPLSPAASRLMAKVALPA
ncbi:MAG: M48 family metalloprotease [Thermoanaerobaculia bacterium]|jgi:predicted Zn-dependent protease|nr:M48 family metalloprotease [Thermoanaerobaculia bacterium]